MGWAFGLGLETVGLFGRSLYKWRTFRRSLRLVGGGAVENDLCGALHVTWCHDVAKPRWQAALAQLVGRSSRRGVHS